jgi:hypothetical protein
MAKWGEIKCPRCAELEAKLEAIEALMVRRIQSVSYNSTDTLSDSRKRKNSVREYLFLWRLVRLGK